MTLADFDHTVYADYLLRIAVGHARQAAAATSHAEMLHWFAESDRFDALHTLALTDPAAARRAYRPTVAWTPED